MNLEDISAVEQVVRCGSLSEASRKFLVSKATLSHRIRRLEAELGVSLFDRGSAELRLTSAGRTFYAYAEKIAKACEEASDAMISQRSEDLIHLRIGTTDELGTNFFAPMALRFLKRAPTVSMELVLLRSTELFDRNSGLDCVIFAGDPPATEAANFVAKKLLTYSSQLCAAPSYLENCGNPASPEQLKAHALVADTSQLRTRPWTLTNGLERSTIYPNGRLSSNDFWMMKLSVVQGFGIGFFPSWFIADDLAKGILVPVLPEWRSEQAHVSLLYRSHRFKNPYIRELIEFFAADFEGFFSFPYREMDLVEGTGPQKKRGRVPNSE
ncbi:transcriptional regulator, LysR family (plasmid) [Rhizobium leguminosarum bv. trifolii WSM2304]|uniref:HTH-type transcriptional regulator TtuA n=1 Tax=Rhizobium leguminosarum bv. trifolii (strain WSM2304) TaxID=395492 RepID=A0ABF7QZM9_RHILW|nr:LysR family transcriptional regulator [Rhizobium leguminosarum]ACI59622.1 transcriptional regulator, LysR family [Rhizobium leguminosarum bv. trifolii WSM2304]